MVRPRFVRHEQRWNDTSGGARRRPAKDGDMAVRSNIPPRARTSRARLAGALSALAVALASANAQPVGPVANFGPATIDVQDDRSHTPAQDVRTEEAPAASESRPLLAPKGRPAPATLEGGAAEAQRGEAGSWARVFGALVVVVGLILVVRAVLRRVAATGGLRGQLGAGGRAPSGVLEVLGRYPIARGQTLVLLRVDQRVLLLSQSGAGFRTLANFDSPTDVASLLMKTRDESSESLSGKFKQMLSAFERDPSMTRGVEQIDLTRRAPLISRRPAANAPAGAQGGSVRRVATPPEAHDAIRRRLASLRESAA